MIRGPCWNSEMRFLIVLIVILLLAFKYWPRQPVPTAEESFIGPQIQSLKKAEQVEEQYLDALDRKDEEMEKQSGG
jgi:hypothetical protein